MDNKRALTPEELAKAKSRLRNIGIFLVFIAVIAFAYFKADQSVQKAANEDRTAVDTNRTKNDTLLQVDTCDCKKYIRREYDKISGSSWVVSSSGNDIIGSDGSLVKILVNKITSDKDYVAVNFYVLSPSLCPDGDDAVNILFTDSTRLNMYNDRKFNCDGNYASFMLGVHGRSFMMDELSTKKIEAIRFHARNHYFDINLTTTESTDLLRRFKCLYTLFDKKL